MKENKNYEGQVVFFFKNVDLLLLSSDICDNLTPLNISENIPNFKDKFTLWSFQNENKGNINVSIGKLRSIDTEIHHYSKNIYYKLDIIGLRGDSGCPLININNEVVGVTAKGPAGAYSPTSFIPNFIIKIFLNKRYEHYLNNKTICKVASLKLTTQYLTSTIKEYLNYKNDEGILIRYVEDSYIKFLKVNDILLKINNINIDKFGNMKLKEIYSGANENFLIEYIYYISAICIPNTPISITIIRNNKLIELKLELKEECDKYYRYSEDENINMFKWCGIIFKNYVMDFTEIYSRRLKTEFCMVYNIKFKEDNIKLIYVDFVIYSHILQINSIDFSGSILKSVNNILIINMEHLINVITDLLKKNIKYIEIEFYSNYLIILINTKDIKQLNKYIYFGVRKNESL